MKNSDEIIRICINVNNSERLLNLINSNPKPGEMEIFTQGRPKLHQ